MGEYMSGKPRMNSLKKFEPFWELGETMYVRKTDNEMHFKLDEQ